MAASLAQMQEQLTTVLSSLSSTNHLVPPPPSLPALPSQPVLSYGGIEAPRYANNVSDERSNGVFDPLGSRRSSLSNPYVLRLIIKRSLTLTQFYDRLGLLAE
jgi:hypothetical protein